ncbi:MAG TPA: hypothetical protein VKA46_14630 [Gemmataceae bacterium]|nr:hypothetical protein [Gemmataceae bacterium]
MNRKSPHKPFTEMTAKELARSTAEFDEEGVADSFHPLTPEERARWDQARARDGMREVSVSLELELLARSDALAKKKGISRDSLIARGLRAILAAEGEL